MGEDVRAAVHTVRDEECQVEVRVTCDAARFARQAAKADFGVVIAAGGDGTINDVVAC